MLLQANLGIILSFILILNLFNISFLNHGDALLGGPEKNVILNDKHLKVEVVFSGIKFPSSMAFLGPNDILVLEKNIGTVKRIVNGTMMPKPLIRVNVSNTAERGMLGIAVMNHASHEPPYVFLYYTESLKKDGDNVGKGQSQLANRLYRYELINNSLVNPHRLLDLPAKPGPGHNGGKITIGPDNNLYIVIGDLNVYSRNVTKSQNYKNGTNADGTAGILYMTLDGKTVKPIIGKKQPLNKYYAYGIRNSFGIAFDPVTGKLWDTENGPGYGDEINLVEPGFNSGWLKIQGIWQYPYAKPYGSIGDLALNAQKELYDFAEKGKYSDPEFTWKKTVGPTGISFLNSDKLGQDYMNDMFVGDFHNGYVYNFDLNENRTELALKGLLKDKVADNIDELKQVIFAKGFGGITDIKVGPDGYLYVLSIPEGGDDCESASNNQQQCVSYNSQIKGTIFKILRNNSETN